MESQSVQIDLKELSHEKSQRDFNDEMMVTIAVLGIIGRHVPVRVKGVDAPKFAGSAKLKSTWQE